jgi:uroporphyrinogen decarboxylase
MDGRQRLLAACRAEPVDVLPVWFMRQAGGRLPAYLRLRERHSVMDIARTPESCAEVSLAAVEHLGVDGAVLFADIMLLVEAMGVPVELKPDGPSIERPLRSEADIGALRPPDPLSDLGYVLEAIRLVRSALAGRAAVIGICGGPFTLAAYLLEGGPSREQLPARALMHGRPAVWARLLDRLTEASIDYLRAQERAGAELVQVFDTWAGILTPDEYRRGVAPWTSRILAAVTVPTILYVARAVPVLEVLAETGPTVLGIDSRQSLATARERLGPHPVQGNLDPALLLAGRRIAREGTLRTIRQGGGIGHVFNLGEAAPRDTRPGLLRDIAAIVHDTPSPSSAGIRPRAGAGQATWRPTPRSGDDPATAREDAHVGT